MRGFRWAFILASVLAGFLQPVPSIGAPQKIPRQPRVKARPLAEETRASSDSSYIVVRFRGGALPGAIQSLPRGVRWEKGHSRSGLHRFSIPEGVSREEVLAALRRDPLVEKAGPGHILRALEIPDDENFVYQWHLHSTEGGMWADSAWDLATNRGAGVVVAVIDTGVAYEDYNDTSLGIPRSFKRASDLSATTFVSPWDFSNDDSHANDDHGHGTHVTGTIVQDTDNGFGEAGVAHASAIMPLKVLDFMGSGVSDDLVEAIYYAVANGAKVINMSIGFPETGAPDAQGNVCSEIVGLNAALDYAHGQGVVLVAAAGNDGGNTVLCPAAHPKVIAVGATRFDGEASFYSNSGTALDIAAPGGDPLEDQNLDGYPDEVLQETFCYDPQTLLFFGSYDEFCDVFYSGTSMATPHVAGTAALLLGEDPSMTPDQVRTHLTSTARDRGPAGWDPVHGFGLLDAGAAVASVLGVPKPSPPDPAAPTDLVATAVSSSRIDLSWIDNGTEETGFRVERSTDGTVFTSIAVVEADVAAYSNVGLPAGNTYHYRVRAVAGPYVSAASNVASATSTPLPGGPTNLSGTAVSSSRIDLNWTDNSTSETGFKIERSTDGVHFSQIATRGANATTYSSTGLTAGILYHYRVRAYVGLDNTAYSNVASVTTRPAPPAPTNLAPTVTSPSRIDLSWSDNSTYEAGFKIERSTDGVNFVQLSTTGANVTTFSNIGLIANTAYHYRVRAYDGGNHSEYSNVATATTKPPPAAPTNLSATAASSSRIVVSWTDNANNEAGVKIEAGTDGVTFSQITVLGANATTYTHANLPADTTYYYRVRAYEGTNHSGYSNPASAVTLAPPSAPANLAGTVVSPSRIDLSWSDNSTYEAGFKIERSTDGVNFVQLSTTGANITRFSNGGLTANTGYHYRVRAYDGNNYSAYSNVATASTQLAPAAPTNLSATAASSSRIVLTWTENATNEAGVKIEAGTDGVTFSQITVLGANATTYTHMNLLADTSYYYRVRVYEGTNHSGYSDVASAVTRAVPSAPTNLAATVMSSSRIDLSWADNSTYESGFKIERSTDGVNFVQLATSGANVTTYSSSGLTANTVYHFRVRAYDGNNHSPYSDVISVTTDPAAAAPSNLSATAVSSSRIVLTWTDNSATETGFKVERSTDGGSFSQIAVLTANATTYTDTNRAAETTYFYRVRASEGVNHSGYSDVASATTLASPDAPSNLAAAAVSSSRIVLTWADNSATEAGFKLERSTDGVTFTQIVVLGANATTYTISNLTADTSYSYRVRAYEGPNHSAYSSVASVATLPAPAAPTNLVATAVSSSRIDLQWTDGSTYEAGFKIERSTDGVNFVQISTRSANATTYTNTGLAPNTVYYYRVRAYDGPNDSGYSSVATATTLP